MSKDRQSPPATRRRADPQKDGRDLHRMRSKIALLKNLLRAIRPGLAVYAKQQNDPFWTKQLADVDRELGNPPAFPPDNRSA